MAVDDKLKVFIVFDEDQFSVDMIKDDLRSEDFSHFFKFSCELPSITEVIAYMLDSDEVWVFGDICDSTEVKFAKEHGKEVWVMG